MFESCLRNYKERFGVLFFVVVAGVEHVFLVYLTCQRISWCILRGSGFLGVSYGAADFLVYLTDGAEVPRYEPSG